MAVRPTDTPLPQRYRTIRRLGTGGMATVFLAEDQRLGRRVAVKRLHADSPEDVARRFEREARMGASLNHPNVVTVYDTAIDDEGVLIVMEYVEGETLSQALAGDRVDTERAVQVIRGMAAALDHAHSNGVVHRDVKPTNVLLGEAGTVKLVDLGIATAAGSTRITASGTVLGTPAYMAPEQLKGGRFGPAGDVYALAAVAFEALSGRKARTGETPLEIAHRAVSDPPPDLRDAWPGAPPGAVEVLKRGMARHPGERPSSAGELARKLCEAVEEGAATTVADSTVPLPATRPEPKPPPAAAGPVPLPAASGPPGAPVATHGGRRPLGRWLLAAAALAIVVAAVVVLGSGGDQTEDRPGSGQSAGGSSGGGPLADRRSADPQAPPSAAPAPEQSEGGAAPTGGTDPALGARLNEQGKSLIDEGSPEEAVPVLEQAVAAFPEGTDDVNYAYALFNLGSALRLSGRPEEAIPVLERRLEIPNQSGDVQRELGLARQAAGEE